MATSKRDQLVETALNLFNREGFRATGIDRILAESGVAKMTLYNHFRSKDELILAALRRRDEQFRNWFARAVERRATTPRDRLLAIFDTLEEWFEDKSFNGCVFINAAAEFCQHTESIRSGIVEHKRLVRSYVRELAVEAGAEDPDALTDSLELLVEGAIVCAQIYGNPTPARDAKKAAATLVDSALREA